MLRTLALVLLLANGLYFAWGHGLLRAYGLGPAQQSEPQHLDQQIAPGTVRLLSPQEYQRITEQMRADAAAKACWQAGPLDAAQADVVRQALASALPAEAWRLEASPVAARWIVYMGKYASAEALDKKRSEVAALHLKSERPANPALEPGLSLGGFDTKAEADAALLRMGARGLHTARVVQERGASIAYTLTLQAPGAAQAPTLDSVRAALGSVALHACN